MKNNSVYAKKSVGGIIVDVLTIGMLFASFAALFYSGFILQVKTFPLGALCAITAVAMLLLFLIGDVSCLSQKVRNKSLTAGFLVFSAIQLVALIVNLALLLALMVKLFSVEDSAARITYVITAATVLIGYVASIIYFSSAEEGRISDGEETDEDEEADEAEEIEETDEAEEYDEVEEVEEIEEVEETEAVGEADDDGETDEAEEYDEAEEVEEADVDDQEKVSDAEASDEAHE